MSMPRNIPQRFRYFVSRPIAIAVLLALALLPARSAWADRGLEGQLKFDYLDKVLTLRHFYSGDHLKFRSDGTLEGNASIGIWALDGQIEVEDVRVHGERLEIKGRRIHRTFDSQGNLRDELALVENGRDKWQKDLEKQLRRLRVEIEIELPNDAPSQKDISSAIDGVFLSKSEFLSDMVPTYWQSYLAKQEGKPQNTPEPKSDTVLAVKRGAGITPPRKRSDPDPEYSDAARKAKYQGTAVIRVVVDPSGTPKDLQIVRPLGLGLDEKAIAAVSKWKFEPAKKDGEPVAVAIMIEINFRLY